MIRRGRAVKGKEIKKQEEPKRAPQKKSGKPKVTKKAIIRPMVHIDDFLGLAIDKYSLNSIQQAGFKAFMTGKHYMTDMDAYTIYLERYLGK